MYNGIDLMQYNDHLMNKYVNRLMTVLYTREEMKEGLIIETETSTRTRRRLDLEKFNLIKVNYH